MGKYSVVHRPKSAHPSHYRYAQKDEYKDDDEQRNIPLFIIVVTIVDIALFIWSCLEGFAPFTENPLLGPPIERLVRIGAKYAPCILEEGQWWRWIAPMFLHVGVVHILMNLYFQVRVAADLERSHGFLRIAPIYLISGVAGNLLSAIFNPDIPSVGASSSLFGLIGCLLVDIIKNWKTMQAPGRALCEYCCQLICILLMGTLPMIDNFAHIGGWIAGLLTSFIFLPNVRQALPKHGPQRMENAMESCKACSCRALEMIFFGCLVVLLLVVLWTVFYESVDTDPWCPNCRFVSCIPIPGLDWCSPPNVTRYSCDAYVYGADATTTPAPTTTQ